jgi:hypothetical protein
MHQERAVLGRNVDLDHRLLFRIHVLAMMRALGVSTRSAAVTKGISEGLVNAEDNWLK